MKISKEYAGRLNLLLTDFTISKVFVLFATSRRRRAGLPVSYVGLVTSVHPALPASTKSLLET